MLRDIFHMKCTFSSALPHERGAACWSSQEIRVSRGKGADARHRVTDEQEEVVGCCECDATHLVLPGTGTITTPISL